MNDNDDYQHGYANGVENTEPSFYEGYLSSKINYDWSMEAVRTQKAELQRIEQEIDDTRTRQKTAYDRLQQFSYTADVLQKQIDIHALELTTVGQQDESLRQRRAAAVADYSLVGGLIFVSAGLCFIFGDLIISHEIVAYALNIRDNTDAWAFAVGLAMVSVLLKPVYDRLIETPYVNERATAQKTYGRFKTILAVFSIVTLAILGYFRYEAYRTDKLKEAINKTIKNLQNTSPIDPLTGLPQVLDQPTVQRIGRELQNFDALNLDLVNSPWALLSFVLSGVLFAVAGAVCLGIGLPILQKYWLKWLQIDPRLWRLRRRKNNLNRLLKPLQKEWADMITQKRVVENELTQLVPLADLRTQRDAAIKLLQNLIDATKAVESDYRVAAYNDGVSSGEKTREMMSDEEFNQFKNAHFTTANLALRAKDSADKPLTMGGAKKATALRPYLAIRKMITDQFGE